LPRALHLIAVRCGIDVREQGRVEHRFASRDTRRAL